MPETATDPRPESPVRPLPVTAHRRVTAPSDPPTLHSCLYEGTVLHDRQTPVHHRFRYRLFLMYLDLDEIEQIFRVPRLWSTQRFSLIRFRRQDYHGDPNVPLAEAVRQTVQQRTGLQVRGPIRLLTHVRLLGFVFNPISIYYCFDETDQYVEAIVADVTNTPWNERHCYVIPCDHGQQQITARTPKEFHVSPFMKMDMDYDWRLTVPADRLSVSIDSVRGTERLFGAALALSRRPLRVSTAISALLRFPFLTVRIPVAIYWQALKLWARRVPFVPHPDRHPPHPTD